MVDQYIITVLSLGISVFSLLHMSGQLDKMHNIDVLYQTRETVFHWDIQTPRRELKIRPAAEYF